MLFEDLTETRALKLWIINCISLYNLAKAVIFLTFIIKFGYTQGWESNYLD
jgi:hypothetical protein